MSKCHKYHTGEQGLNAGVPDCRQEGALDETPPPPTEEALLQSGSCSEPHSARRVWCRPCTPRHLPSSTFYQENSKPYACVALGNTSQNEVQVEQLPQSRPALSSKGKSRWFGSSLSEKVRIEQRLLLFQKPFVC